MTNADCTFRENICFFYLKNKHSEKILQLKSFLEDERHASVYLLAETGENCILDQWEFLDTISKYDRYVVFLSNESVISASFTAHLQLISSTPEHLVFIFPVLLDDIAIPDIINHFQVCTDKDGVMVSQETKQKLLSWLDDKDTALYKKEQEFINQKLSPLSLIKRLHTLRKSCCSIDATIISKVQQWDEEGLYPILTLKGDSGCGKTLFLTNLYLEKKSKIVACHFIPKEFQEDALRSLIKNLAAQLASRLPQYRRVLTKVLEKDIQQLDECSLFETLILEPLKRENPNSPHWIFIDGVHFINDSYGQNALINILIGHLDQLPFWLKIIISYEGNTDIDMLVRWKSKFVYMDKPVSSVTPYRLKDEFLCRHDSHKKENPLAEDKKTFNRLPVFISYGHDEHTQKVIGIRDALIARGHEVWIDRSGIPQGADWRRKIYDGIRHSELFLAFISDHSVKSDYCQTEIRIAIGAPEHIMPTLPLKLEKIGIPACLQDVQQQTIDISEWPDPENAKDFAKKVKDLEKWLDDKRHKHFCDETKFLYEKLTPFSFEARLSELMNSPFVGRKWLLDLINQWDKGNSKLFSIVGGAGFGKSVFAANLRYLCPDKIIAAQFIEWNMPSLFSARTIIKSLAFQLAARLTEYRKQLISFLKRTKDLDQFSEDKLFESLLTKPLQKEKSKTSKWIIVDALDEATQANGVNPFVATLVSRLEKLPSWLKVIVTTRPDDSVVSLLEDYPRLSFSSEDTAMWQYNDMKEYILLSLSPMLPVQSRDNIVLIEKGLADLGFSLKIINTLIAKSQNMFLYLKIVCQDIIGNNLKFDDIDQLPEGLYSIFGMYFERQFAQDRFMLFKEKIRPLLTVGAACREGISIELLQETLQENGISISCPDIRDYLASLGTLQEMFVQDGITYFQFIHRSIWEWLSSLPEDARFYIDIHAGHTMLSRLCLSKIDNIDHTEHENLPYVLRNTIPHLLGQRIADEESLWRIMQGEHALLPSLQETYLKNQELTISTYHQVIQYYMERFLQTKKESSLLPKIARLILSEKLYSNENKKNLKTIFRLSDLNQILKLMKSLPPEKYLFAGWYLIGKSREYRWNIDGILDAIDERCAGEVNTLDGLYNFMTFGPLKDAIKPGEGQITNAQLMRLLQYETHVPEIKKLISNANISQDLCLIDQISEITGISKPLCERTHGTDHRIKDYWDGYGSLNAADKLYHDIRQKTLSEAIELINQHYASKEQNNKYNFPFEYEKAVLVLRLIHEEYREASYEEITEGVCYVQNILDKISKEHIGSPCPEISNLDILYSLIDILFHYGQEEKARKILLDYSMLFSTDQIHDTTDDMVSAQYEYWGELCRFDMTDKAYRLFEDNIFQDSRADFWGKKTDNYLAFLPDDFADTLCATEQYEKMISIANRLSPAIKEQWLAKIVHDCLIKGKIEKAKQHASEIQDKTLISREDLAAFLECHEFDIAGHIALAHWETVQNSPDLFKESFVLIAYLKTLREQQQVKIIIPDFSQMIDRALNHDADLVMDAASFIISHYDSVSSYPCVEECIRKICESLSKIPVEYDFTRDHEIMTINPAPGLLPLYTALLNLCIHNAESVLSSQNILQMKDFFPQAVIPLIDTLTQDMHRIYTIDSLGGCSEESFKEQYFFQYKISVLLRFCSDAVFEQAIQQFSSLFAEILRKSEMANCEFMKSDDLPKERPSEEDFPDEDFSEEYESSDPIENTREFISDAEKKIISCLLYRGNLPLLWKEINEYCLIYKDSKIVYLLQTLEMYTCKLENSKKKEAFLKTGEINGIEIKDILSEFLRVVKDGDVCHNLEFFYENFERIIARLHGIRQLFGIGDFLERFLDIVDESGIWDKSDKDNTCFSRIASAFVRHFGSLSFLSEWSEKIKFQEDLCHFFLNLGLSYKDAIPKTWFPLMLKLLPVSKCLSGKMDQEDIDNLSGYLELLLSRKKTDEAVRIFHILRAVELDQIGLTIDDEQLPYALSIFEKANVSSQNTKFFVNFCLEGMWGFLDGTMSYADNKTDPLEWFFICSSISGYVTGREDFEHIWINGALRFILREKDFDSLNQLIVWCPELHLDSFATE